MPWYVQILRGSEREIEENWDAMESDGIVYEFSSEDKAIKSKKMCYPDQVMHENSTIRHKFYSEIEASVKFPKRKLLK